MRDARDELSLRSVAEVATLLGTTVHLAGPLLGRLADELGSEPAVVADCIRKVMQWPIPLKAKYIAEDVGLTWDSVMTVACVAMAEWHELDEEFLRNIAWPVDLEGETRDWPRRTKDGRPVAAEPGTLAVARNLLDPAFQAMQRAADASMAAAESSAQAVEALEEAERALELALADDGASMLLAGYVEPDDMPEVCVFQRKACQAQKQASALVQLMSEQFLAARPKRLDGKRDKGSAALGRQGLAALFAVWAWEESGRLTQISNEKRLAISKELPKQDQERLREKERSRERSQFKAFALRWLRLLGADAPDAAIRDAVRPGRSHVPRDFWDAIYDLPEGGIRRRLEYRALEGYARFVEELQHGSREGE